MVSIDFFTVPTIIGAHPPQSPWQNPYVERMIGSIRRGCLNHFVIFNARHPSERSHRISFTTTGAGVRIIGKG